MQAHEHRSWPQILSGIDEEGGELICPFRLEASGWDGFPRFSPSIPFITFLGISLETEHTRLGKASARRAGLGVGHSTEISKP